MAEFRSRNNREKKVTTTTRQRQYREASAIDWNTDHLRHRGSKMLGEIGYDFVKTDNPLEYQGKTYDYVSAIPMYRRDGDRQDPKIIETLAPGELYGQKYADGKSVYSSFDTVRSKMKTGTQSFSTTSWTAKDRRDGASSDDVDKASTINRKKKGRSGLRIALKGDASDGRLKGNKGQVKKKAGAQGGGKSGLNMPR